VLQRQERGTLTWPACRVWFLQCAVCGGRFTSSRPKRQTCGEDCQRKRQSQYVSARVVERYHTDPEFRDWMLAQAHARRADKLGLDSNAVLLSYLIKRDKGRCQVPACLFPSRKVAPLGSSGPMKPSIDHKIPLSKGGTHDLANTQLAHYRCNLSKNNRGGGEQLLLIGLTAFVS
jgi:5-methylcytosine-specific restriction endonuclease McrA